MKFILRTLSIIVFLLALSGCSSLPTANRDNLPTANRDNLPTANRDNWIGHTESGEASFYDDKFQNRKTASGERYNHSLKTAAHNKIPFGSSVKVTNKNNGKSVVVKVNDRGPFAKGRVIDLSKSAFSSIGNLTSGVINVTVEVVQ